MKSSDVADPATVTTLVDENLCILHAGSLNSRNTTGPVGRTPPTRKAVSRTGVPTGPPDEGAARMPGTRFMTTMVNVWHAGGPSSLVPQTVVGPKVPAPSGTPVTNPTGERVTPGGRAPAVTENVVSGIGGLTVNRWR